MWITSVFFAYFTFSFRLDRTTPSEYVLGDTGIKVSKDCVISVPVYAMHYDPEYFPDPTTFDPRRFV